MGRTSGAVKDMRNKKNYDDIRVRVSKGHKTDAEAYCVEYVNLNGLINAHLRGVLELTEDEWTGKQSEVK